MTDRRFVRDALERFEGPLLLYARRLLGDDDRARDLVQDTFLKLCRLPPAEVETRAPHLREWLFTVCRNGAIDLRRKERVMRVSETVRIDGDVERPGGEPAPEAAAVAAEQGDAVLAQLASLPEKQQEVLRLKFQGELSYREIAAVTGESIGNVGWLIHQGLKTLRRKVTS